MQDRIINEFKVFKYSLLLAAMRRPRSLYVCLCVCLCKVILFSLEHSNHLKLDVSWVFQGSLKDF